MKGILTWGKRSLSPLFQGAKTLLVYNLTSTAQQGAIATPDYMERQMSVTIAK